MNGWNKTPNVIQFSSTRLIRLNNLYQELYLLITVITLEILCLAFLDQVSKSKRKKLSNMWEIHCGRVKLMSQSKNSLRKVVFKKNWTPMTPTTNRMITIIMREEKISKRMRIKKCMIKMKWKKIWEKWCQNTRWMVIVYSQTNLTSWASFLEIWRKTLNKLIHLLKMMFKPRNLLKEKRRHPMNTIKNSSLKIKSNISQTLCRVKCSPRTNWFCLTTLLLMKIISCSTLKVNRSMIKSQTCLKKWWKKA